MGGWRPRPPYKKKPETVLVQLLDHELELEREHGGEHGGGEHGGGEHGGVDHGRGDLLLLEKRSDNGADVEVRILAVLNRGRRRRQH